MFMTLRLINEERLHKRYNKKTQQKIGILARCLGDAEKATQIQHSNH